MISKHQKGDTIIEVLLAMSIIGLVLGASFGIANRSVQIGRDAQERTEALKIAESQIEIFKGEYFDNINISSRTEDMPFCLYKNGPNVLIAEISDNICKNTNGNGQEGLYLIEIVPPSSDKLKDPTGAYEFKVSWSRLGATSSVNGADINSISLYYKTGAL